MIKYRTYKPRLLAKTITVRIPASAEHEGLFAVTVKLRWTCPECGELRGETFKTISFDGSRRLGCDGWINPCGHTDYYSNVRKEAWGNGLNGR